MQDDHTPQDDDLVPVTMAAAMSGIPERTLRRWIARGQLPATAGHGPQRGRRVRLGDVRRLADLTGHAAGHVAERPAMPAMPATSAADTSGALAARAQLDAIRDEWLAPLIDRIGALERDAGRLGAELDQAARERDAAIAERDRLREALERAESRQDDRGVSAPAVAPIEAQERPQRAWWRFWERS